MSSSAHTAPANASAPVTSSRSFSPAANADLQRRRDLPAAGRGQAGQQLADLALPDHGDDARRGRVRPSDRRPARGQVVLQRGG